MADVLPELNEWISRHTQQPPSERAPAAYQRVYLEHVRDEIVALRAEVARLKRGEFTEEEFQNLCHNFKPCDLARFRKGCEDYQAKLFGFARPDSEEERLALKAKYEGQTEPCCECGSDYPRGDLVIDGEIYCPSHRKVG